MLRHKARDFRNHLAGRGSSTGAFLSQGVSWGASYLKASLGLKDPLPRCLLTAMAAGAFISAAQGPLQEVLEGPHNMAAGFPRE